MKKKRFLICIFIASFFTLLVVGANPKKSQPVKFQFFTDTVEIELIDQTEYNTPLVPNTVVPINAILTNKAAECYVRFVVDITINEKKSEISHSYIGGISDGWVLAKDNKFYLNRVFKENESINLFEELHILDLVDECKSGDEVILNITADAVQVQNFIQDLNSEHPWLDQEIQDTIRSRVGG